jgi:thiamine kinase-like enzyme
MTENKKSTPVVEEKKAVAEETKKTAAKKPTTKAPAAKKVDKEELMKKHQQMVQFIQNVLSEMESNIKRMYMILNQLAKRDPENIIKTGADRIGLIDFTDLCLSDFARDLGAFLQQLEYKIVMKIGDHKYAEKMKQLFLTSYLVAAGLELDANLQTRINLYYNWTAMRTSTYWFLKFGHNEERAEALLKKVKDNLNF